MILLYSAVLLFALFNDCFHNWRKYDFCEYELERKYRAFHNVIRDYKHL